MIFLSVGSNTPFDRLVKAVDEWAGKSGAKVLAQIGDGEYLPRNCEWKRSFPPEEFSRLCSECGQMVSHAGTGTIMSAMQAGKPLLVLPRRAALGETRNDHQVATVTRLGGRGLFTAAMDETELREKLALLPGLPPPAPLPQFASGRLIEVLRKFVFDGEKPE